MLFVQENAFYEHLSVCFPVGLSPFVSFSKSLDYIPQIRRKIRSPGYSEKHVSNFFPVFQYLKKP